MKRYGASFTMVVVIALISMMMYIHTIHYSSAGTLMSLDEMTNTVGANGTLNCVKIGTVCGFGGFGYPSGTPCANDPSCSVSVLGLSYVEPWSCATGFTDQYTCSGPSRDPNCNNTAKTIDCGAFSLCGFTNVACVGGTCQVTAVSLCGVIPWIGGCGPRLSCR